MRMKKKNPAAVYLSKWVPTSDTYKTMSSALDRVAKVLGGKSAETYPWQEIRYEDARGIPALLQGAGLSLYTVNKLLAAVRGVLDTAWRMGAIPHEEFQKIDVKNLKGKRMAAGRALLPEELDIVEKALGAMSPQDAALIAVLVGAGLRRVEVVGISKEDYNPKTGRVVVIGKRNKEREVPIGKRWRPIFEAWWRTRKPRELLFDFGGKDPRRHVSYVISCFKGIAKFTPHDLRRTFITRVIERADIIVAKKLAGHESVQTTEIYDRRGSKAEDDAVEDL